MAYQYKREPLNRDETARLEKACQTPRERLVVWTLLDTGLRVGELARLSRQVIDWQGHRLTIFGKGGPYGKKTKRRVVPMTPRITPLLEAHFAVNETLGIPVRTIQHIVRQVAKRAVITRPVSPHVLRHTYSVNVIQKNISLPALQRLLGHDHLGTTEIYLNMSPEHVLEEFHAKW
jgi:integrase/recombinase XerD